MAKELVVNFKLEKTTPGALRYQETKSDKDLTPVEIGKGAKVGTLYVRKTAVDGEEPKTCCMTLKF